MILEEADGGHGNFSSATQSRSGYSLQNIAYNEACNELIAYKEALDQNTIVSITNRSGVITYANEKFCKTSKYRNEELVGRKISRNYPPLNP